MATHELDTFLRKAHATAWKTLQHAVSTVPGIGPGGWDSKALANAQGSHFDYAEPSRGTAKTVYRIYTQDINRNATLAIVRRYFEGATAFYGIGLDARTQTADENSVTFEIITSKADSLQRILDLAGDIRIANAQVSVLVSVQGVTTFEVTERTATHGEL